MIVPVYNVEKYLPRCVDSLIEQTHKDYEIILIDDGSTDNSGAICDGYAAYDTRVRVCHQKNLGVSSARNVGIKMAEGKFITFVDADDWVGKNYLSELRRIMMPGGMAACNAGIETFRGSIENSRTAYFSSSFSNTILNREEAQLSLIDYKGFHGYMCAKMFDRDLIKKHRILVDEDIAILEDTLFVFRYLMYSTSSTVWCHKNLYHYWQNPESALNGRYRQNTFHVKTLSEYIAIEKVRSYAEDSERVYDAYRLQQVKSNINTLRVMTANHYKETDLYRELLRYARKNCFDFLASELFSNTAKISVLLGCIHPRLEYWCRSATRK